MKLWEVLKALEENPNRKFKYDNVDRIYTMGIDTVCGERFYELTAVNDKGNSIDHLPSGGFDGNFTLDSDWQEVKQPVPWQEAIEAWVNGKWIKCVIDGRQTIYKSKSGLQDSMGWAVSPVHIATGTWYIED